MGNKPILEITDIEELICLFLTQYFSDNVLENINNMKVVTELPKTRNENDNLIIIKKLTDNSTDNNFYRLQGVGFNCFAPTWSKARKLAIRVEAVMNSYLFVTGNPVARVIVTTGPIKTGSYTDAEAKVYYLALQIKTKSNAI